MRAPGTLEFERTIEITADPPAIIAAFFDPQALATWWQAVRSVTAPRPLGVYAVEWKATAFQDDVLGRLGGVFHGRVMEFREDREFLVADAHWLPPESDAIGPMALEVRCRRVGPSTELRLRQSAAERGERWERYHDLVAAGWTDSLNALKQYLEQGGEAHLPPRGMRGS